MDIASGERFNALYYQNAKDILTYLLRRAATPEDAADCLAETFLIAWNKQDQIPADARPWLFGVARKVLRRGHERDDRAQAAAAALARNLRDAGVESTPPPTAEPVIASLENLSVIDREIVTLIAWDSLTPREVAKVLGLSPNVVRVRAHRARTKLRRQLSVENAPVETS
ncbi:MAG: RNA polymerase sigma factor [Solirubrobacteraceae bacterium]